MALRAPRTDQNNVTCPPGSTCCTLVVKNSIRGAFGFGARVTVARIGATVLVGPNNGVGDGPDATERGVTVGVAPIPGVELGVGVKVSVAVGRAVGITCRAVAPQALIINESKIMLSRLNVMQYLYGCKVELATLLPRCPDFANVLIVTHSEYLPLHQPTLAS